MTADSHVNQSPAPGPIQSLFVVPSIYADQPDEPLPGAPLHVGDCLHPSANCGQSAEVKLYVAVFPCMVVVRTVNRPFWAFDNVRVAGYLVTGPLAQSGLQSTKNHVPLPVALVSFQDDHVIPRTETVLSPLK